MRVVWGRDGLVEAAVAGDPDVVVVAVVGSAGLQPTLAALAENKTVALSQ